MPSALDVINQQHWCMQGISKLAARVTWQKKRGQANEASLILDAQNSTELCADASQGTSIHQCGAWVASKRMLGHACSHWQLHNMTPCLMTCSYASHPKGMPHPFIYSSLKLPKASTWHCTDSGAPLCRVTGSCSATRCASVTAKQASSHVQVT